MSFTEENIKSWNDSLLGVGMPREKIGQAIALIQMLHTTDSNLWNFENCDRLIAGLVQAFTNGENIDEILINMAQAANAPVGSPTILKVEQYRKTFLYLLAAGVSFATLQTMAPGVISFILDATYALFQELLKSNSPQAIAQQAVSASPLSAGSMAQAIAVSSTNLVTAAFYTCADIASRCAIRAASAVSQNYAACLRYGTELLSFAVATRVVPPVVEKATKAVKSVAEVAAGSADEKIAQWIDEGGPQKVQAAITAAGTAAVENTKIAIGESIKAIDEINRAMTDPSRAPNRFIGPTINDMIQNALQTNVEKFRGDYRGALGELISDLSQINFDESPNDYENPGILAIMQKYNIRWDENPGFRALIAVWKLATEKKNVIKRTQSQKYNKLEPWAHPAELSLNRSVSLSSDRMAFPVGNDPFSARFGEKSIEQSTEQIDLQKPFNPSMKVTSQLRVTPKLEAKLRELGLLNSRFPSSNEQLFSVVGRLTNNDQRALIKALNRTPSQITTNKMNQDDINRINEENEEMYLGVIEEFLNQSSMLGKRERGGRKSRSYKKRKATIKGRRVKRRLSRKGKKRIYTKKRR